MNGFERAFFVFCLAATAWCVMWLGMAIADSNVLYVAAAAVCVISNGATAIASYGRIGAWS